MNRWKVKPIPGFSRYLISPDGEIFSLLSGKRLQPGRHKKGYLVAQLKRDDDKFISKYVHRLMLLAYVGLPSSSQKEARHLDGNPANNSISNLAWGTTLENARDKHRHGTTLLGEKVNGAKLTLKNAFEIREAAASGVSASCLGNQYHVHPSTHN